MRLQGTSQRQIAASLQISRNTVKKYWDGDSVPWERKNYSREASVLTENVVAFVRRCLEEDTHSPKKQHHTAKRIYDRLVDELGFTGGETTVRRLVSQLREKPQQEAFVPLSFPPGDAMQIDWGEATVYLSGVKTAVNLFCARLCYSGAPLVLAYRRQNEESFLDALVQVFQYFGGVPRRVIFDNGKVAVKDGFGAHARKQAGYAALAAHYGFEAIFCNPASGNEKGLVEGLVGYSRRNTCVPVPRVDSMEELNALFQEKCRKYLSHQIRGKEANVGLMLAQEKEQIKTLISDISHQIKTPVAAANTFAQLLDDKELSDEERSEYTATLQTSLEKLTFLTNSLIKMSRLESGMIRLKPERNSLNNIILQAVKTVYAKAKEKNITIAFDYEQNFEALLDFNWTAEAITNILDNAVKYTPNGGIVGLTITEYPSYLRLDISDNGIGIPEEEQAKIFGRFYRGKYSAGIDGVGIGLYLTRDIINKQYGYIKVISDKNGSTFSIFFKKEEP